MKLTEPLQLAWVTDDFDPERVSDAQKACHSYAVTGKFVSPILWEIRRERRMEFLMEQYRCLDIRRWGQLELMDGTTNPDILVGGWVELDKSKELIKRKYNLLTKANVGVVSVRHIDGYNADGTIKLGERIFFDGTFTDAGDPIETNADQMEGFQVPQNIKTRDARNFLLRNYLEPICTDVISQYKDKDKTITQNPGWE